MTMFVIVGTTRGARVNGEQHGWGDNTPAEEIEVDRFDSRELAEDRLEDLRIMAACGADIGFTDLRIVAA